MIYALIACLILIACQFIYSVWISRRSHKNQKDNKDFEKEFFKNKNQQFAYETALEEMESGHLNSSVWARAYSHTDNDDAAKRMYIRERAKEIIEEQEAWTSGTDSDFQDDGKAREESMGELQGLGGFGWFSVVIFFLGLYFYQVEKLYQLQVTYKFPLLTSVDNWTLLTALALEISTVIIFLYIHKLLSGHSFGKWPINKLSRPRTFFAIWVGIASAWYIPIIQNMGIYYYFPDIMPMTEVIGMGIILGSVFASQCLVGLAIMYLYKKVVG